MDKTHIIQNSMPSFYRWSSLLFILGINGLGGCGEGVDFIREGDQGGVILYSYADGRDPSLSPGRPKAMEKIHFVCPNGHRIVKEGETSNRRRVIEGMTGPETVVERRWGIRFQCR
jgi:hypothetical protein